MKQGWIILLGFLVCLGCAGPGNAGPTVELERRADGLVYQKGHNVAYTGQLTMTTPGSQDRWVSHYKNGVRDGQFAVFYSNGQRKAEAVFEAGKLVAGMTWKSDGSVGSDVQNGTGTLVMFHPDGSKARESVYLNGDRVSRTDFPATGGK